jgi:anti-sigma factor RsiW
MNIESQLKLQAFLDGELPEVEAREVATWLARDQEAALLLQELRHTRQALKGFDSTIRLPETREFFWSKVEREIRRQEQTTPAASPAPKASFWLRFLVPSGALAIVIITALFGASQLGLLSTGNAAELETASTDSGGLTYRDYSTGTTLIWLSYPAEREVAQNEPAGRL